MIKKITLMACLTTTLYIHASNHQFTINPSPFWGKTSEYIAIVNHSTTLFQILQNWSTSTPEDRAVYAERAFMFTCAHILLERNKQHFQNEKTAHVLSASLSGLSVLHTLYRIYSLKKRTPAINPQYNHGHFEQ